MEHLCDHPLLLSLSNHTSIEDISAVRTLSLFFREQVDMQAKALALSLGIHRPVRHYKNLLFEYARTHFTTFIIPELKPEWLENAVKENKLQELKDCSLTYEPHYYVQYATSTEMIDYLQSVPGYNRNWSVCPSHSSQMTLRWLGLKNTFARDHALQTYIKRDNVEEIMTLAKALKKDIRNVHDLYQYIGPNLFQALNKYIPIATHVRTLMVSSHEVAIHFIENGTIPDLKKWVRAGLYNVELMQYLFEKGIDKEYVRSVFDDIVSMCNIALLQITVQYLGIESLEGKTYLLECDSSREYIRFLHGLGGRICVNSLLSVINECCCEQSDDPGFLEDMIRVYGKQIVYTLNRGWFHNNVVPDMTGRGNMRILAFCIKHRKDYEVDILRECIDEDCEDDDCGEVNFDEYDMDGLSVYQREKLDFYLA